MSVRVRDREKQTEKEIGLGLAGSKGCFMDSIFLQRERCIHVSEETPFLPPTCEYVECAIRPPEIMGGQYRKSFFFKCTYVTSW